MLVFISISVMFVYTLIHLTLHVS